MLLDGARIKKIAREKVIVHQDAQFAFRFTQTLTPQCNISLVNACFTGTWSMMLPVVVKVGKVFHVISGWQGLLFSGAMEDQIFVVVLKDITNEDADRLSVRFAVSMLLSQLQKTTHNGAIAELAKCRPELLSGQLFNKRFDTPRSLSYSLAPIDPKSVDTQLDRIFEARLGWLRSKK